MNVRKSVSRLAFPLLLTGAIGTALGGLHLGWSRHWIVLGVTLAAAGALALLERAIPFAPEWRRPRGDVAADLLHSLLSTGLVPALFQAACFASLYAAAASLSRAAGSRLWPSDFPLLAQLALALVVGDFGAYWGHRWSHEIGWLWRFHATHHSAERLYWLNAGRFHPIDTLLGYAPEVIPLILLGPGPEVLTLFTVYTGVNGMLRHANVEFVFGPLNRLFSTADLHRWHHSKNLAQADANYSPNLMVWDVLFGTRLLPAGRPSVDIGIADRPDFPKDYLGQLAEPFRRPADTGACVPTLPAF